MAEPITGAHTSHAPVISNNTAEIIRHKATYFNGTGSINIPLVLGTRFIIQAIITAGPTISIGFGQVAGTITESRFTFTQGAGPLDLSDFFRAAPFVAYKAPSASFVYLIITGTGAITAAVTAFNG